MKNIQYLSGQLVHVGDRVNIRGGHPEPILGNVVFVIDSSKYSSGFAKSEWSHYGKGFMIKLDDGTLVLYEEADDPHLALVVANHQHVAASVALGANWNLPLNVSFGSEAASQVEGLLPRTRAIA